MGNLKDEGTGSSKSIAHSQLENGENVHLEVFMSAIYMLDSHIKKAKEISLEEVARILCSAQNAILEWAKKGGII